MSLSAKFERRTLYRRPCCYMLRTAAPLFHQERHASDHATTSFAKMLRRHLLGVMLGETVDSKHTKDDGGGGRCRSGRGG